MSCAYGRSPAEKEHKVSEFDRPWVATVVPGWASDRRTVRVRWHQRPFRKDIASQP